MNPVIKVIKKRRSVRSFESRSVPKEIIEKIIDAGNWAPTGHNLQRWRFVVVEEQEFRQRLIRAALPTWKRVIESWQGHKDDRFREYITDMFTRTVGWPPQSFEETLTRARDMEDGMYWSAPVVIFVIGTAAQECAMVCENMMLAAHSLGLGSCIVGFGALVTDDPTVVEALELGKNEKIHGPIVLGYTGLYPEPPEKKGPVVKWI